jgi:hypothetical protein
MHEVLSDIKLGGGFNMRTFSLFAITFLLAAKANAINAPSNLAAVPATSERINLTWTDNSNNETGFKVERAPDNSGAPGTFALIATLGANVTSYPSTGLSYTTKYWYRVVSYRTGQTATSGNASATTTGPHHLTVAGFPSSVTAGVAGSVAVTVLDANNNLVANFSGPVAFSSTDAQAALPPSASVTNGTGNFNVTLKTAGLRSISAITGGASGSQNGITVNAAAAATIAVSLTSANSNACDSATILAIPQDAFGNQDAGYSGTVGFTSSDTQSILPGNSALAGAGSSYGITMKTLGAQWVRVTDTANATITGEVNLTVNAGAVSTFALTYPSNVYYGDSYTLAISARDGCNNVATSFTGQVTVSSDAAASIRSTFISHPLPQVRTVTSGALSLNIKMLAYGQHYLFVQDGQGHMGQTSVINVVQFPPQCQCEPASNVMCGQDYYDSCNENYCGQGTAPGGYCPVENYQCGQTAYDNCGNACGTGTQGGGSCDTAGTACGQPVYDQCGNQCGTGTGPGGQCDTYNYPCGDPAYDQCGNQCGTGTAPNYNQCYFWGACYWEQVFDYCGNYCGNGQNSCGQ